MVVQLQNEDGAAAPGERVALVVTTKPADLALRTVMASIAWDPSVVRYDSIRGGPFFDQSFAATPTSGSLQLTANATAAPANTTDSIVVATAHFTVVGVEGQATTTVTTGVDLGAVPSTTLAVLESRLGVFEGGENLPPTAEANGPYSGLSGEPIAFDGAGFDADGVITRYDWRFGDGRSATDAGPRPTHVYDAAGRYNVVLTVYDHLGASATDLAVADIGDGSAPKRPNANAGPDQQGEVGESLTFDGSLSTDVDSVIVSYEWSWGDGSAPETSASPTATHSFTAVGTYTVTLTVTDATGLTDTDDLVVAVIGVDPPVADAGADVDGTAGSSVSFDGSASSDPNGDIVSYTWDFGDGTATATAPSPSTTHVFATVGTYTVTLTVEDSGGRTSSDQITATMAATRTIPTAVISAPTTGVAGQPVTFSGSGSLPTPGDTLQFYRWDFGDPQTTSPPNTASGAFLTRAYPFPGTYTVRLTVEDSPDIGETNGPQHADSVTITITNPVVDADAELRGRWVMISGSQPAGPVANGATVQPGDVIELHICVANVFDPSAAEVRTTWNPAILNLPAKSTLLQSTEATAHPDCRDSEDDLDEFFSSGPATTTTENVAAVIDLPPGLGRDYVAGLAKYRFTVTGTTGQAVAVDWTDADGDLAASVASHRDGDVIKYFVNRLRTVGSIIVSLHALVIG
jgi:PKD repeat protein